MPNPNLVPQISALSQEVMLDGTWIATNLKKELSEVTWQEANTKIGSLNTIALLTFHLNYYIAGLIKVLEGGPLDIRDKYSFDMPAINGPEDWDKLRQRSFADAEKYVGLISQLPEERINEGFVDVKYGNYFRNLIGVIEHSYYHLGQIVILKKLIKEQSQKN